MASEYLVFYETDEPGTDEIHLEAHARQGGHAYDVDAGMDVSFDNTPSGVGIAGVTISLISMVLGVICWALYLANYPESWFENKIPVRTTAQVWISALAIMSVLGMIFGVLLAIIGRRVTATAELDNVHLVDLGRA